MQPLFALLKKEAKFEWQGEHEEAFKEVKHRIIDVPILMQHDPEKEITIETNASDYAIRMRMTQLGLDRKP